MLFNSHLFVFFYLPSLLLAFAIFRSQRKLILLLFSFVFYGYTGLIPLFLLILSCLIVFIFIQLYSRIGFRNEKPLILLLCIFLLLLLGYFKYYPALHSFLSPYILNSDDFIIPPPLLIVIPAGISFYTFQLISFFIDFVNGKINKQVKIMDLFLFAAYFPQLIAGPIMRAKDLLPFVSKINSEYRHRSQLYNDISVGFSLITFGLFQKTIFSDLVSSLISPLVELIKVSSDSLAALAITIGYSSIIFSDFSGYSLCAIGLSLIIGIPLVRNFYKPFYAFTLSDFWRRWHVTLSYWLRDYLYIPLGGNQNYIVAILITFLVTGLWHGSSLRFFLWGGLHGMIVLFEKLFTVYIYPQLKQTFLFVKFFNILKQVYRLIVQSFVALMWPLFFLQMNSLGNFYGSFLSLPDITHFATADILTHFHVKLIILLLAFCFLAHWISEDPIISKSRFSSLINQYQPKTFTEAIPSYSMSFNCSQFLFSSYLSPYLLLLSVLLFSYAKTFVYFSF